MIDIRLELSRIVEFGPHIEIPLGSHPDGLVQGKFQRLGGCDSRGT
jgi:hypothetical protein